MLIVDGWPGHATIVVSKVIGSLNEEVSLLVGTKLSVRSEPLSVIESNKPWVNSIVRPVRIPINRDTEWRFQPSNLKRLHEQP